jgi:hypothetical protein
VMRDLVSEWLRENVISVESIFIPQADPFR